MHTNVTCIYIILGKINEEKKKSEKNYFDTLINSGMKSAYLLFFLRIIMGFLS